MILTLDVGGTLIKYACMEETGTILHQDHTPTPRTSQAAFLNTISDIVKPYQHEITGIAVSLPGTIDPITGQIIQGGSLTYNSNTNLKKRMVDLFHVPVTLENDAHCAAIAEHTMGNLRDIQNGILLTFGTGIGGCLLIQGSLYRGTHCFAGEVSAWITNDPRTHGTKGLWGAQGSIPNLCKRICREKGVEIQDGRTVFSWIAQKDATAVAVFQQYCTDIVVQLFNLTVLLDPQRICIGGGISQNPVFLNGLQQAMDAFFKRLPIAIPQPELMACRYHNDANLYGAYQYFIEYHAKKA